MNIKKKISNINSVTLKPLFRRIVGWDEIEEKNNTIHFFLNNYFDIEKLPKATGLLRQVQLADTELLRIVTDILTKNNLTYWLDYGTLLGAVRHKGFIPWDDDLDIAMPREDYEKAISVLSVELGNYRKKYNIECSKSKGRGFVSIYKAGLILDIVPYDNTAADSINDDLELQSRIIKCKKHYRKHQNKNEDYYCEKRKEIIGLPVVEKPIWFQCPEWGANTSVYTNEMIFPLRKIQFEDYEFFVPNDFNMYLAKWYGDYMKFPKSGVLHHKGYGSGIYNNSKKSGIKISDLINELKSIKP